MPRLPSSASPLAQRALVLCVCALVFAGCRSSVNGVIPGTNFVDFDSPKRIAEYLDPDDGAGPLLSAHRGGYESGFPENSLEAMQKALTYAPALLEVDVQMTADSVLVLLHDRTLDRTTTVEGELADYRYADLAQVLLVDLDGWPTRYRIPRFEDVLLWAEGKAVLTLDIKRVPPQMIVDAIRATEAEDQVVVIVYDVETFEAYQAIAPDLVYSITVNSDKDLDAYLATGIDLSRTVAFTGVGQPKADLIARLTALDIRSMVGTFGDIDDEALSDGPEVYQRIFATGAGVIATNNVASAARALPKSP
ncbi:MAG: glycerophosphodiester phosphodiesterase family protein [Bacteroidota bacterium]